MNKQLEEMLELMNENEELKEELKIKNSWIRQAFYGYVIIALVVVLSFIGLMFT